MGMNREMSEAYSMFMAECKKAGFTNAQAEFMFEMYWRRYQGNK